MIDLTTYALLRKQITTAASGISDVRAEGDELVFVLVDGHEVRVAIPATEIRDAVVRDDVLVLTLENDKEIIVDATLTQSGQAADAKVTGDVVSQLKDDKVDKDEILNAGIRSFSYVPLFGGAFTVTTTDEEGYIKPHALASVTGRISKHYTYRLTVNGVEYVLPCDLFCDDLGSKVVEYLGNISLYTSDTSGITHDIHDVPFCIISDLDDNSSIDVFTQSSGTVSITVEQIQKEQTVLPKSLILGDDYCPIELKKLEGSTYSGISIGVNRLRNARVRLPLEMEMNYLMISE